MTRYEKFTPVIGLEDVTDAEKDILENLVALEDSPSGQFIRKVAGVFVNALPATGASIGKKEFQTSGGSQTVALDNTPLIILDVVILGQAQQPEDYSISGNGVIITLPGVPSGKWGYITYTY